MSRADRRRTVLVPMNVRHPDSPPQPTSVARRAGRPLLAVVALGCALVALELLRPFGGAGFRSLVYDRLYDAVIVASALLCWLRAATEREDRAVWTLVGAAVAAWGAGDVYWTAVLQHVPAAQQPYPSLADLGYLSFYGPAYLALVLLVRSRVARFARSAFLDGIIATLMLAALAEAIVLPAVLRATGGSAAAVATNLAYPVADSLLVALGLTVVLFGGRRLNLEVALIALALLAFGVADSVYAFQVAEGTYRVNGALDLGWVVPPVLLAVAAWSPRAAGAPRLAPEGWVTMVVPATLSFGALGVEVYDHFHQVGLVPLGLASGVIALSMVRLLLTFAENQRLLRKSRNDARTDPLTGLANRRALVADATALFAAAPVQPHVLAIYDLDGFKTYNDTFGHLAGDALLVRLGKRIREELAGAGTVYRLGGDEFCLLAAATDAAAALDLVARAGDSLVEEGARFTVRPSFGAALVPEEAGDVSDALRLADRRMYLQKATRPARIAGTRDALVVALHERDRSLGDHVDDVGTLAVALAHELGLEQAEVEKIRTAAVLHDIGKLGIPDDILGKPATLSADERAFVETHTLIGERILAAAPATAEIARFVRATHERWDGGGYPDGLRQEEIPLAARIVFVCDAFHAMTSDRPYQARRTAEQALAELAANAGTQFDPRVVAAFPRALTRARSRAAAVA